MPRPPRQATPLPGLSKRADQCNHRDWMKCDCDWYASYKGIKKNLSHFYAKHKGLRLLNSTVQLNIAYAMLVKAVEDGEFKTQSALAQGKVSVRTAVNAWDYKPWAQPAMLELKEHFGTELLAVLAESPDPIEKWLKDLAEEREWRPKNFNLWCSAIFGLFEWARVKGYRMLKITSNPMDAIDRRPTNWKREVRITLEMEKALRANADAVLSRCLDGALCHGLRRGEMLLAQMEDISFTDWILTIPAKNSKAGKTTGADETIYIEQESVRQWMKARRIQTGRNPKAFIWGTDSGERITPEEFYKLWRPLYIASGIPVSNDLDEKGKPLGFIWHDLRHEFGYRVAEQSNGNILAVKEAMRHSSTKMSERYLAKNVAQLRSAMRFVIAQ
jgi:integrase